MSKKQKKQAQEEREKRFEDSLDKLVRVMLTPEAVSSLLKDKAFVKKALLETRKVQRDEDDIKELGDKYNVSSQMVSAGLTEVEEVFTKILGE